jgi:hypothetical protein
MYDILEDERGGDTESCGLSDYNMVGGAGSGGMEPMLIRPHVLHTYRAYIPCMYIHSGMPKHKGTTCCDCCLKV